MTIKAEPITGPDAFHGEGPVWLGPQAGLRWVDQLQGDVLELSASGSVIRQHVGSVAAVVRPRRRGGSVVATGRGLVLRNTDDSVERVLPDVWADATIRFNDGGCDPQGRLYVGTMAFDEAPGRGTLFRFDGDYSVSVVLEGLTVSNGLGWSPDGTVAYYIDSATHRVDRFDFTADGCLTNRRALVAVPDQQGTPDGLTVDSEGAIWVALWGGSAVHRYTPDGGLDQVVAVQAKNVTACTFGGADLNDLYITTSGLGLKPGTDPHAGSLFRCQPGVPGLPANEYSG